jgi:hypothetical protein
MLVKSSIKKSALNGFCKSVLNSLDVTATTIFKNKIKKGRELLTNSVTTCIALFWSLAILLYLSIMLIL